MFQERPTTNECPSDSDFETEDSLDVRRIIERSKLPGGVKVAPLTAVIDRIIDPAEIARLTTDCQPRHDDEQWAARIDLRRQALTRHLGNTLICVLIKLPGIFYTIEIDPNSKSIIHYEWHAG